MAARTKRTAEFPAEGPANGAQPVPAQPAPKVTGVITIVEDGTIAIQGISIQNAGAMARIMIGIANELMNLSATPQPNGAAPGGD